MHGDACPSGIRHLLSLFEEGEVIPEGDSVAGLFRTLNVYLYLLARCGLASGFQIHARARAQCRKPSIGVIHGRPQ
jgi:hypothetical protein